MRDEIFWGNLIGLLKTGKWNLGAMEAQAFSAVFDECVKRSKPIQPIPKTEPIKVPPSKKENNGNK